MKTKHGGEMLALVSGDQLPGPGYCCNCMRSGVDCMDTGRSRPFDGAILVCVDCLKSFVKESLADEFVPAKEHQQVSEELLKTINSLKNEVDAHVDVELKNVLREIQKGWHDTFEREYVAKVHESRKRSSDTYTAPEAPKENSDDDTPAIDTPDSDSQSDGAGGLLSFLDKQGEKGKSKRSSAKSGNDDAGDKGVN